MKHLSSIPLSLGSLLILSTLTAQPSPVFQRTSITLTTDTQLHYTFPRRGHTSTVSIKIHNTTPNSIRFSAFPFNTRTSTPTPRSSRYSPPPSPLTAHLNTRSSRLDVTFFKNTFRQRAYLRKTPHTHQPSFLWTSRSFCERIQRFGSIQNDPIYPASTTYTLFRHHTHQVFIDERRVLLPTLQIATSDHTLFSILDDCTNPLILEIKTSDGFHTRLQSIHHET